jgi:hypothetical protein
MSENSKDLDKDDQLSIQNSKTSEKVHSQSPSESFSLTDSSEDLNNLSGSEIVSKSYLKKQLTFIKKDLENIENNIESQLECLKHNNFSETEDLERRIMMKINWLNQTKDLKENPTCCSSGCEVI